MTGFGSCHTMTRLMLLLLVVWAPHRTSADVPLTTCTVEVNGEEVCVDASKKADDVYSDMNWATFDRDYEFLFEEETDEDEEALKAKGLRKMIFKYKDERPEPVWVYRTPDVSTFYKQESGMIRPERMRYTGLAGKFINMSEEPVRMFWDPKNGSPGTFMTDIPAYDSGGTATYPGHVFYLTSMDDEETKLKEWKVISQHEVYIYDPVAEGHITKEDMDDVEEYEAMEKEHEFIKQYRAVTGREYLAVYKERKRPVHHMWRADYYDQKHFVDTRETHFHTPPSPELLNAARANPSSYVRYMDYANEPRTWQHLRGEEESLTLNLTVLSCAPKVFSISNFLSDVEVDHVLDIVRGKDLPLSETRANSGSRAASVEGTRTSHNTWVNRGSSPIVDAIYRRAADLMRIDEALFRDREPPEGDTSPGAIHDMKESIRVGDDGAIAEELQLVHYKDGSRYTPHHDFVYPERGTRQPARFATLLLYLNEGMTGGETTFPRWVNAKTSDPLEVKPEKGKAVLFYSILPDGNMDTLSQHEAKPVYLGEKWLTNLWVWDPYKEV